MKRGLRFKIALQTRKAHKKLRNIPDNLKHTDETELPEELQQEDKRLTLSFGVNAVTAVDSDIPAEVNQDEDENKSELRLLEPQLLEEEAEFPFRTLASSDAKGNEIYEKL